ncbi:hypothetical protein [Halalkalicoccus salilacus]|uniref:hypothetical protein n=1 Tax=Halalkalicoccus salilacus TaxID=3117459 RepID=UPI00300EA9F3
MIAARGLRFSYPSCWTREVARGLALAHPADSRRGSARGSAPSADWRSRTPATGPGIRCSSSPGPARSRSGRSLA